MVGEEHKGLWVCKRDRVCAGSGLCVRLWIHGMCALVCARVMPTHTASAQFTHPAPCPGLGGWRMSARVRVCGGYVFEKSQARRHHRTKPRRCAISQPHLSGAKAQVRAQPPEPSQLRQTQAALRRPSPSSEHPQTHTAGLAAKRQGRQEDPGTC